MSRLSIEQPESKAQIINKLVSDMEVSLLMSNLCYPPLTAGLGRVRRKVDGGRAYSIIHPVRGVGFGIHAPR
jgi:hypothetical protein